MVEIQIPLSKYIHPRNLLYKLQCLLFFMISGNIRPDFNYVKCVEICYITYKIINIRYTECKMFLCSNIVSLLYGLIEFLSGK